MKNQMDSVVGGSVAMQTAARGHEGDLTGWVFSHAPVGDVFFNNGCCASHELVHGHIWMEDDKRRASVELVSLSAVPLPKKEEKKHRA